MADKSKCDEDSEPSMTDNGMNQKDSEFDDYFEGWISEMNERIESIRESEVLTQEDLAVRINVSA